MTATLNITEYEGNASTVADGANQTLLTITSTSSAGTYAYRIHYQMTSSANGTYAATRYLSVRNDGGGAVINGSAANVLPAVYDIVTFPTVSETINGSNNLVIAMSNTAGSTVTLDVKVRVEEIRLRP
jgi:hypothetical protein